MDTGVKGSYHLWDCLGLANNQCTASPCRALVDRASNSPQVLNEAIACLGLSILGSFTYRPLPLSSAVKPVSNLL